MPSPPLALFVVMLSKAYLALHSRMSGSMWVITPLWLSWSWRSFSYSSSVYSCHLLLISSASVGPYNFCPLSSPSLHEMFPWYLQSFLFCCFPLFLSILLLRKASLSILAILLNSAFRCLYLSFSPLPFTSLLFTAICKASSASHFAFFAFLFYGDGLIRL